MRKGTGRDWKEKRREEMGSKNRKGCEEMGRRNENRWEERVEGDGGEAKENNGKGEKRWE